ncbi:MAG: methionine gamma-lyase family protein [Clostridia bacterium]|nr:methionine gamma-lyase family protein [Clostridia bacterium]
MTVINKEKLFKMNRIIEKSIEKLTNSVYKRFEKTALANQKKVLDAFIDNRIALRHFSGTSGYGYDDAGRDTLAKVLAQIFGTESALVSPMITSGTQAITLALFGVLRPGDLVLSITGEPYDTLNDVIFGKNNGSLAEFGISFENIPLIDGQIDAELCLQTIAEKHPKMVYIQRSRGYSWRLALSIDQIEDICMKIKQISPNSIIFCDNCYGEFVESKEPTAVGVDLCAGSFIKNIGGGIAPTGGYVAGKSHLIEQVAGRLTAPSVGSEVGSYAYGYRLFYQGLFMAPHVVCQALKTAALFSDVLQSLNYEVLPKADQHFGDIVCSVKLGSADKVIKFCQAVQFASPVDGYVSPEPWDMPGYNDQVIMAAGCFVQGSSIELSCDGPIRPPYIVYLQGGITLEHGILALEKVLQNLE